MSGLSASDCSLKRSPCSLTLKKPKFSPGFLSNIDRYRSTIRTSHEQSHWAALVFFSQLVDCCSFAQGTLSQCFTRDRINKVLKNKSNEDNTTVQSAFPTVKLHKIDRDTTAASLQRQAFCGGCSDKTVLSTPTSHSATNSSTLSYRRRETLQLSAQQLKSY